MAATAPDRDSHDLAGFGYKQTLNRTLGGFSSFAVGFSYLSILTGLPQLFYLGFGAGGPAFFWTWPLVFAGQFLVALNFAELAARYPISGGVYQWSKQVGSDGSGWMAGWVYLCCAIITLASVALALQSTLPQLLPVSQIIGEAGDPSDAAKNGVLLGCLLIVLSTVINAVGVRLLSRINNVGVFAEIVGALALIALFFLASRRGASVVLETQGRGAGLPLGYFGPLTAAALTASFVMYGFDTAGSLAEETDNPRRRAPRAILLALGSVGVVGALLILGALRAAPSMVDPELGRISGGMALVIREALGPRLGRLLLCDVILAIVVCTLTVHAAAVRLMFSMARDNNLPCSEALARISATSRTPTLPAVLLGFGAALILVLNVNFPQVIAMLASVSIVWANLAYLFVTVPLLGQRLRGNAPAPPSGSFSMGRWGLPVNLMAALWGVLMIVNVGWPRAEIYGESWPRRFVALIATSAMLGIGALYYAVVRRHRTGVLETHRAEGFATGDPGFGRLGGEIG